MFVRLSASRQNFKLLRILVPVLCLSGCATTANNATNTNSNANTEPSGTSESTANTKGMPKWMQDAFSREVKSSFKTTQYSIDGLGIKMKLPGKPLGELQDTTTSKFMRIDIGAGEAMGCEVYYVEFDPAYSMSRLADINFKQTSERMGKLSNKSLYYTDSGAYDDRPYHALEWAVNFGEGKNKKIALFKYRLALIGEYGLICQHPEVGYRNTFENAFKYMVEHFEYDTFDNKPYLVEIASLSINNKAIGFYLEKYFKDADGDTIVSGVSSMLIPTTNQSITAVDKFNYTYSTPQGEIINSFKSSAESGDLTYDLALDFDRKKDAWIVTGDFRGKPIEKTLTHDDYIDSSLGQRIVLKQIAQSDDANSGQIFFWDPDLDPTNILSSTLNLSEKTGEERLASYNVGPAKVTGTVDSNGSMKQSRIAAGSQVIVVDRIWLSHEQTK